MYIILNLTFYLKAVETKLKNRRTLSTPCWNRCHIFHPGHDLPPKGADLVVGMWREHELHALHSCLFSWHSILIILAFSWDHQNKKLLPIKFHMVKLPGRALCYKTLRLLPVPSWAVLLLSRSVMISAWMSLILLRSAARLYSICSDCVRGITCFKCTCAQQRTHIFRESWNGVAK